MGKGALVYIFLGPQYAALGTFPAWFFVVFQAVSMVVAVAQSAVSQLSAGRCRGGERSVGLHFFRASVRSVRQFFRLVFRCFSSCVSMVVAVAQSAVSQLSAGR